jgi:hypothetical protein
MTVFTKQNYPVKKVIALKKLRLKAENPTFDMSFRNKVKIVNRDPSLKHYKTSLVLFT